MTGGCRGYCGRLSRRGRRALYDPQRPVVAAQHSNLNQLSSDVAIVGCSGRRVSLLSTGKRRIFLRTPALAIPNNMDEDD